MSRAVEVRDGDVATAEAFGPDSQVTRRQHDASARPTIVADVPDDIVRLASYSVRPSTSVRLPGVAALARRIMDYLGYVQTWIWILGIVSTSTVGVVIWARITGLPGVVVFVLALGTVALMLIALETVLVLTRRDQRLECLEKDVRDFRRELLESLRADIRRFQAEAVSVATIREARVRIAIHDYDGAIRAARECYSAAQSGNTNYIAHALDAISNAMNAAAHDGAAISHEEIVAVREMLFGYSKLHSDERAVRLMGLLNQNL